MRNYIDDRIRELFSEMMDNRERLNKVQGDETIVGSIEHSKKSIIGNVGSDADTLEEMLGHVGKLRNDTKQTIESIGTTVSEIELIIDEVLNYAEVTFIAEDVFEVYITHRDVNHNIKNWKVDKGKFMCYNIFENDLAGRTVTVRVNGGVTNKL